MDETSESCPNCSGKLKQDVIGIIGALATTMAGEVANPIKAFTNAARDVQLGAGRRKAADRRFKCTSCGKAATVCPNCDRAFVLTVRKRNSEMECPHCRADLYLK